MDNEPLTLLCVDDEIQILNSLKRTLRKEFYSVLVASSTKEALRLLKEQPIQVVMTDYRMPEMSGIELAALISKEYPRIVVILLSGYADPEALAQTTNGENSLKFLFKPWNDDKLKQEIELSFKLYSHSKKM